jgi:predicted deacylase
MPNLDSAWEQLGPGERWGGRWEAGIPGVAPLPVLAARGMAFGPILLVTAAVHGDEYEGPAAIARLFQELQEAPLRGMLLGLPVVHGAAWEARSRVSPADGIDLNRVFLGSPAGYERGGGQMFAWPAPDSLTGPPSPPILGGVTECEPPAPAQRAALPPELGGWGGRADSPTEALAYAVFETFVRRCDVLIDLHSGGAALVHLPLVGWYRGGSEAERLACGFGAAFHPWLLPDVPGVLSAEAHRAGKVALGAEWHGGARLDLDGVAAYADGLRRVMAALEMLPAGPLQEPDSRPPVAGGYQTTPAGGLFIPRVKLGERVEAGAVLGVIDNLEGAVTEIRAERAGTVAGLPHRALLHPGDRVAYVG